MASLGKWVWRRKLYIVSETLAAADLATDVLFLLVFTAPNNPSNYTWQQVFPDSFLSSWFNDLFRPLTALLIFSLCAAVLLHAYKAYVVLKHPRTQRAVDALAVVPVVNLLVCSFFDKDTLSAAKYDSKWITYVNVLLEDCVEIFVNIIVFTSSGGEVPDAGSPGAVLQNTALASLIVSIMAVLLVVVITVLGRYPEGRRWLLEQEEA